MADDPTSAWDVTAAPTEAFKVVAKSAGEELKKRLLGKEDSAKKDIHGFDMYATELYQDILARVLSHEVSGIALYRTRSLSLSLPYRNSRSDTAAGSLTGPRFSSRL
jgi:hypothetical protein